MGRGVPSEARGGGIIIGGPPAEGGRDGRGVVDLTAVEAALREVEEKNRAIVEQSSNSIYLADLETLTLIDANPALQSLLGYSRDELVGKSVHVFIAHSEDDIDSKVEALRERRSLHVGERLYRRKDGELVFVEVRANIISYGGKEAICIVAWDVTERKKRERELQRMNELYKDMSKITRHDIGNKLTRAMALVELMRSGDRMDLRSVNEIHDALSRSIEVFRRLGELEHLLMRDGSSMRVFDLREVVEEVIRGYDVEGVVTGELQVVVDEAITSVIDNLIQNATVHGEASRVEVELGKVNGHGTLRLSDDGVGIPESVVEGVFHEGASFGSNAGSGLGLFLVKKTMERYGGTARIVSGNPSGTVVELTF